MWPLRLEFRCKISVHTRRLVPEASPCDKSVLLVTNAAAEWQVRLQRRLPPLNRPFARSGHMVRNKLCWDVNNAVGLWKQRNSYQPCPLYATMSIGIMGSKSLALLDWGPRWFSNKERGRTNTCLCCFLPPRWNILKFTQATVKTTITQNNVRHGRVSFSRL